ncbi:MAG TPA: hypothetical protein VE265_13110, partial [Actinomycetota bacterium]|nr:hypothetical protein [Actinomycetota bacterium]
DWGLTRQLRDAQCHPIWEGSENICVLDVLRTIRRDQADQAILARVDEALSVATSGAPSWLAPAIDAVATARTELVDRIAGLGGREPDAAEAVAARLCDLLVRTTAAALLLEQAGDGGDLAAHKALIALRYTRRHHDTGATWSDNIAATAGRDLLAYAELDPDTAAKAAV